MIVEVLDVFLLIKYIVYCNEENKFMKQKNKQIIVNIITIINIVIIIIFMYNLSVNSRYSRKYIKELLEKGYNYKNYIIQIEKKLTSTNELEITKITQKEDARKVEYVNKKITKWYLNDIVIVDDEQNNIRQYAIQSTQNSLNVLGEQFEIYMYIDNADEYKYIKKETYKDKKCIVFELKNVYKDTSEAEAKSYDCKYWIDNESGFILKQEKYCEGILEETTTYSVKECCVTNEDIKQPNIEEYKKIDN